MVNVVGGLLSCRCTAVSDLLAEDALRRASHDETLQLPVEYSRLHWALTGRRFPSQLQTYCEIFRSILKSNMLFAKSQCEASCAKLSY